MPLVRQNPKEDDGLLLPWEAEWVEIQPFLKKHGYKLRPRYHPNWKPSWTRPWKFYKDMTDCSDWIGTGGFKVIDAVRSRDGARVVIKRVVLEEDNVEILETLNSPKMREDPGNNAVPLLEVLPLPTNGNGTTSSASVLLVMPMLFPLMTGHLPFRHVREVLEALEQLIQGIQFLHKHNIAHRDACRLNFMMDPTYVIPSSFHHAVDYCQPDGETRIIYKDRCSVAPVKYYLIDFETADYFAPGARCVGRYGQVKYVPEMSETVPYDPFKLDVYQLGDVINKFVQEYEGLDFLAPLSETMRLEDPAMRPTAAGSLEVFQHLVSSLESSILSQDIWLRKKTAEERKIESLPPKNNIGYLGYFVRWCRKLLMLFQRGALKTQ